MAMYMQTADVARQAGITPGLVRKEAAAGKLEVAARTERGGRLFTADAVRAYLDARRVRVAARQRRSR